jgi:hypothetical protein
MATIKIPRRNRLDLNTPAELAIHNAMAEVEKAGADVRLTDAINLLSKAKELVADFVDAKTAPQEEIMPTFEQELKVLINRHSKEVDSCTSDYILAEYLNNCLATFNKAVIEREKWYGNIKFKNL